MSWCPFITLPIAGSCWKHPRALKGSISSSWMVMVGNSITAFFFFADTQIHKTSLSPFADVFITAVHIFALTVYMGSWFDHVREYCAARDELDIHFVQYEQMLKVGYLLFLLKVNRTFNHEDFLD